MITLTMSTPDQNTPSRRALRAWVAASSLIGLAVTGVLVGLWLDRTFATTPLWLLVCSTAAIVLGMYQLMRQVGR